MKSAAPALLRTIAELRTWRAACGEQATGLVPTMGALHEGHATLLRRARAENEWVLASIFVNAPQFQRAEDLALYPRSLERDLALCAAACADAVYVPSDAEVYPESFATWVEPGPAAALYEGVSRPGHFRGVLTVVLKLLQRVQPQRAYFGEKDAQQLFLVRRMIADFDLPVEVIPCSTVREADGLALSSRNRRLTPNQRGAALCLIQSLQAAQAAFQAGAVDPRRLEDAMAKVLARAAAEGAVIPDYAAVVDDRDFGPAQADVVGSWRAIVAAEVHGIRLIDNLALTARA